MNEILFNEMTENFFPGLCINTDVKFGGMYTLSSYVTIRLRVRNFYEVIVNEGELAQVNYRFIEIERPYQ